MTGVNWMVQYVRQWREHVLQRWKEDQSIRKKQLLVFHAPS